MRNGRKRRLWLWWLLLSPLLLFAPVFPSEMATYECVGPVDDPLDRFISRSINSQRFILEHGQLYLLYQRTWHAVVLVTWVRHTEWSPGELQELRRKFPELILPPGSAHD